MTQSLNSRAPCPLCGRITRAHTRLVLADVETVGSAAPAHYRTTICRDCAVAMVMQSEAVMTRASA